MSKKIYNEIILQWNEKTKSFDTISEDSYFHEGPIAELKKKNSIMQTWEDANEWGEEAGDDFSEGFTKSFANLEKEMASTLRKLGRTGASAINKAMVTQFAGVGAKLQFELEKNLDTHAMANNFTEDMVAKTAVLGEEMANTISGAMSGMIDEKELGGYWDAWEKEMIENLKMDPDVVAKMREDWENSLEGLKLKNLEDKIKESIKSGVEDALSFIPENAFTNAIGLPILKEGIADALKKSFLDEDTMSMLQNKTAGLKTFIMDNLGLALGLALGAALAIGIITSIASATDQIGEEFGAAGVQFQGQLMGAEAAAIRLGYEFSDVAGSVSALSNNFGVAFDDAIGMSRATMDTARALGTSTENAATLTGLLMTMSGHSADSAQNFLKQTAALAKSAGVAPGVIMEDMAGATEEIATHTQDSGENIAQAAVKARSMGLALSDVAKVADGLLEFENSLNAEMEASVLIGRSLNLQRARELSLAGDFVRLQDDLLKQVGSEAEWNEMNAIQRKAMADAIGLSVEGMAKMVTEAGKTTSELARMRELDISEIASKDAISNITALGNLFKSMKIHILSMIAGISTFGGLISTDSPQWVQMLGAVFAILVSMWTVSKLMPLSIKLLGKSLAGLGPALATLGTTGSIGIPVLVAIGLVGLTLVGVLSMLPPIIDSIVNGLVAIGNAIIDGIVKLASPEVMWGIMGLAGAFVMLAGSLSLMAWAGVAAKPVLMAVAGIGAGLAAFGALSALGGGGGEDPVVTELKALKTEIQGYREDMKKKYIPALVTANINSAKKTGAEVVKNFNINVD